MYEFDDLPLSPIEPATNVLVAGPALSGTQELFRRMVTPTGGTDEGTIVVSAGTNAEQLTDQFAATVGEIDGQRFGVVDCVSRQQHVTVERPNVRTVASPRDLTGIGIELTDLYEAFFEREVGRVRTGLDSISTLLMYADLETLFRFLHVFTGRISTADGLGVFVVDPESHDDETTRTIAQLFDGRVDVRNDGERELRVRGLAGQPTDWTPF